MWYKSGKYSLYLERGKAKLYNDNKIEFIGNDYTGIRMFIQASNNDPKVRERFKTQLEKRNYLRI
tara:strand:- start:1029 stop:1223 length:195 start_codon:yes stop_codon:yes gene_type:complete